MFCSPVEEIIHFLKLLDYLLVQAHKDDITVICQNIIYNRFITDFLPVLTLLVFHFSVTVNFVCSDGTKIPTKAKVGDNLLDVVIENDVDLDGYGWLIYYYYYFLFLFLFPERRLDAPQRRSLLH